jgi:hypothetical protein
MSYLEAFRIGWTILWRTCAWVATGGLAVLAVQEGWRSRTLTAGSAMGVGLVLLFYIFPRIIRGLTAIDYRDFRLTVHRSESGPAGLTYLESLVLLFSIYLANAFFSLPIRWLLHETYQFVVLLFYPLVVAAPFAAYILVNFPSDRFELEVERVR